MNGENFIFVVAIDKYLDDSFSNLFNAKLDAKKLLKVLSDKYGFKTIQEPLFDSAATRANIIQGLNSLTAFVNENDSIIIYYAGHGTIHSSEKFGYWIPSNANMNSISDYIHNSEVIDYIRGIKAKHILLISDSCFSGTFLLHSRGIDREKHYLKLSEKKSRWVLASGRDENVSDGQPGKGSPFANSLIDFFEENEKIYFSFTDIVAQVQKDTGDTANQQPIYSHIVNAGHENGQMVFKLIEPINKTPKTWDENLNAFCDAKSTRPEWPYISKAITETKSLGIWCNEQRSLKRKGKLHPDKVQKLLDAGFIFEPKDEKFYKGFGKFIAFMRKTGLNYVPKRLQKKYASEDAWHKVQQKWYTKTPTDKNNTKSYPLYRYELLIKENIPLEFEKEKDWEQFKLDILNFYETHERFLTIPGQKDKDPITADLGKRLNGLMDSWKDKRLREDKVKFLEQFVDIDYGKNRIKRNFEKQVKEYEDYKILFPNQEPKQTGKYGLFGRRIAGWKTKHKHNNLRPWKIEILKKYNILKDQQESRTVQLRLDTVEANDNFSNSLI